MKVKQKLAALISGATGVGLVGAGGIEEENALGYINQYNSLYNRDWGILYTQWKDAPATSLERLRWPTESIFRNAFNSAFNQDYGYLLKEAAPYQTDATILFSLGAVGIATSLYLLYRGRKKPSKPTSENKD